MLHKSVDSDTKTKREWDAAQKSAAAKRRSKKAPVTK